MKVRCPRCMGLMDLEDLRDVNGMPIRWERTVSMTCNGLQERFELPRLLPGMLEEGPAEDIGKKPKK